MEAAYQLSEAHFPELHARLKTVAVAANP